MYPAGMVAHWQARGKGDNLVSHGVLTALRVRHDLGKIKLELGGMPLASAAYLFDDWVFHELRSHQLPRDLLMVSHHHVAAGPSRQIARDCSLKIKPGFNA